MSVRIMTAVWAMDLPAKDKLVLLALADCANDEGIAWPSIATLARKCGCDERTIQRNLRVSEAAGILRREEIRGKGNRYYFTPDKSPPRQNDGATKTTKTPGKLPPKPSRTVINDLADAKSTRAKSSGRIPETWMPGPLPPKVQTLTDLWPPGRLERELDGFRDYWLTRPKDFRRENWDRVWWNRIRDIHDRVMRDNRHARQSPRNDAEIQNPYARVAARHEAARAAGVR